MTDLLGRVAQAAVEWSAMPSDAELPAFLDACLAKLGPDVDGRSTG